MFLKETVNVLAWYHHAPKLCASAQVASVNLATDRFFAHAEDGRSLMDEVGGSIGRGRGCFVVLRVRC